MKLKLRNKVEEQKPSKKTVVTPAENGFVRVWHQQTVKQSLNYQSAEAQYGIEIHCSDDPDKIEKAVERCEEVVEAALFVKFKEQGKLLNRLTGK